MVKAKVGLFQQLPEPDVAAKLERPALTHNCPRCLMDLPKISATKALRHEDSPRGQCNESSNQEWQRRHRGR